MNSELIRGISARRFSGCLSESVSQSGLVQTSLCFFRRSHMSSFLSPLCLVSDHRLVLKSS